MPTSRTERHRIVTKERTLALLRSAEEAGLLWQAWQAGCAAASQADPAQVLRAVLSGRGLSAPLPDLRRALALAKARGGPDRQAFTDALVPLIGTTELRLEHAFTYFCDRDAELPVERLRAVLLHLFHDEGMIDALLAELDANGDRSVTLADFRAFHPDEPAPPSAPVAAPPAPRAPSPASAAAPAPHPHVVAGMDAISPLRMQTGFFRLLQGAAYRTFRESYSANSESHLRARDLPYTVADFAAFVRAATDFYLSLGLVTGPRAKAEFAKLVALVDAEHSALRDRIARWDTIAKTPAMLAAEAVLEQELAELVDHRRHFAEAVDYLLALRAHGIAPADVTESSLSRHERDRLRHAELADEHGTTAPRASGNPLPYHDSWCPVILTADAPRAPGTIMPVAFWYDAFLPQLLLCASILTDADLDAQLSVDAATLDAWHADYTAQGAFDRYGTDLRDGFAACPVAVKRSLRQAWRLTEHYLNSLQKRRERAEFGRDSGFLSQYVAFIDVHLGRSDVADAEMRLSFPYYIGPAVWGFLHTAANLAEDMAPAAKAEAMQRFKAFFRSFATMYPCPYCRYHLNRYVVRNREVHDYPIEFLLLGQRPDKAWLDISLDDRLATISPDTPGSFVLFVWKLHNAVSSSIARTEDWYHREAHPLYTTRFWPGLDSEIARLRSLSVEFVPVERLATLYGVIKPSVELAILRDEIQLALAQDDHDLIGAIAKRATEAVARVEAAMLESGLLAQAYAYDPDKTDPPPHLTAQEESFSRSGLYVER